MSQILGQSYTIVANKRKH
uniref:Uncharacterized protein n=1 Tax=Arundo donax TaxID=35708 RepID=A0A0A8ZKW3_ARUDO